MTEYSDAGMAERALQDLLSRQAAIRRHRHSRMLGTYDFDPRFIRVSAGQVIIGKRQKFRVRMPRSEWQRDWLRCLVKYPHIGWVTEETIARHHIGGRTRSPKLPPVPTKPSKAARR